MESDAGRNIVAVSLSMQFVNPLIWFPFRIFSETERSQYNLKKNPVRSVYIGDDFNQRDLGFLFPT